MDVNTQITKNDNSHIVNVDSCHIVNVDSCHIVNVVIFINFEFTGWV